MVNDILFLCGKIFLAVLIREAWSLCLALPCQMEECDYYSVASNQICVGWVLVVEAY